MRQNGQITCTEWIKTRDRRRMKENEGRVAVKQRTLKREERRMCRREGGYGGLHYKNKELEQKMEAGSVQEECEQKKNRDQEEEEWYEKREEKAEK